MQKPILVSESIKSTLESYGVLST